MSESIDIYRDSFSNDELYELNEKIHALLNNGISQPEVNKITAELCNLLYTSGKKVGVCKEFRQNVLKFFFKNLNRNPRNDHVTSILNCQLIANAYTSENKDINMPFTVQEVTAAIKRLKNNKSAGIDGILNEFLKHCPQ